MKQKKLIGFMAVALIGMLLLSACGGSDSAEPTEDPNAAITQVVETAMAALTQTALVQSPTPSVTPTILPTNTPIPTMQPSPTVSTLVSLPTTSSGSPSFTQPSGQTSSCDIGGFVKDVTIPDGTNMAAGQTFTKTWEIKNNGTCTWNKNYLVVFYGGEQMAAQTSFTFTETDIEPGESVQISVPMTAPTKTGEFISYWILRNDLGQNFFINGSSVYVEIIVGSAATVTPTVATNTPAPNAAPTVSITAPADSSSFASGATITFTGTANDAEDGNISTSIVWSSDIDGVFGTAASINYTPSDGSHTITASITDSGGKKSTFSINIQVGP